MKSIILAAGSGQRLRPYTDSLTKCLVTIGGTSLLSAQVAVLNSCGVDDITVVTGYRADAISSRAFKTIHNPRYDQTNMVSTLFVALDSMDPGEPVIVSYGDIVYEQAVLEKLLDAPGDISVTYDVDWERLWRLRMDDPLSDAESLKLDANGRIVELGKRPIDLESIQGQYIGLMKFRMDIHAIYTSMDRSADYDGKDFDNMYMTSFIQHLIDGGNPVDGVPIRGGWLEVDSATDLEIYNAMHQDGSLSAYCNAFS